jgi:hypothetical protein
MRWVAFVALAALACGDGGQTGARTAAPRPHPRRQPGVDSARVAHRRRAGQWLVHGRTRASSATARSLDRSLNATSGGVVLRSRLDRGVEATPIVVDGVWT